MTIQTIEQRITQLLGAPAEPLSPDQKENVYAFAAGLFAGSFEGIRAQTPYTLTEMQALRALAHKHCFYLDYFFQSNQGAEDLRRLGLSSAVSTDVLRQRLLDIQFMTTHLATEERKAIAQRSADWARGVLAEQLAHDAATDEAFTPPERQTVNYAPDALLEKAASVRAYHDFFRLVGANLAGEPDQLLARAKQAVLELHVGRLNTMAAVDVFPGLLALEDQLTRSKQDATTATLMSKLAQCAPAIGALHDFSSEARAAAREAYARHLDAIRQGAAFELDDVDEKEALLFTQQSFQELLLAVQTLQSAPPVQKTALGAECERISWDAQDIQAFTESLLASWDMLSAEKVSWADVDHRSGFAPDEKFQVIITPHRKNMSVDSTRRVINIPATITRPLAGVYPAGALPLIAHELTHVLQAYADYDLGQRIPLARMKGRRYRILREAGGVYQEYVLARDYFGMNREPNDHYMRAYQVKAAGGSRIAVARAFYESLVAGKALSSSDDAAARELAVNRTSRLYRYGGHSSQVLDYVEQAVVCSVLLQYLAPEQVNAFLLGGASFNLEDSAALHHFGLYSTPTIALYNPAQAVMKAFLNEQ